MTLPTNELPRICRTLPFLQQADEKLKQQFLEQATLVHLAPGQQVCEQGSGCTHLALLLDGTVRVYKLAESGKEITLYRIDTGESCILTASCILSDTPFPAFAICDTAVTAVAIPSASVQHWLSTSPTWRDYIFGLVASRLSNIISVVEDVAFRRMDRRIANYLCQRFQGNDLIRVTHQSIASELGTSREVVSRILKDFEHETLLQVTRGTIRLVDPAGLKRKCDEN
ncbi:MAG: Crp/Fnr family transcriptional regulator [Sedimenticola sp.]|nr:Crp/Fnr family transcriptional regulator [Sedimenticola sp.]